MEEAHLLPAADVLRHFSVTAEGGLSPAQVTDARERYGPNGARSHPFLRALDHLQPRSKLEPRAALPPAGIMQVQHRDLLARDRPSALRSSLPAGPGVSPQGAIKPSRRCSLSAGGLGAPTPTSTPRSSSFFNPKRM